MMYLICYFLVLSHSFGVSDWLGFVVMAFPGFCHLNVYNVLSIRFPYRTVHIRITIILECLFYSSFATDRSKVKKKGKRKVQGMSQSQTAALPRHQEEEETDKSKQAQNKQTYKKH